MEVLKEKEPTEEFGKAKEILSMVPKKLVKAELAHAQEQAQKIFTAAWEPFEGKVENSEISRLIKNPETFKNADVKYAYNEEKEVYSAIITIRGKKYILSLEVDSKETKLLLTNLEGKTIEFITQKDDKIEVI